MIEIPTSGAVASFVSVVVLAVAVACGGGAPAVVVVLPDAVAMDGGVAVTPAPSSSSSASSRSGILCMSERCTAAAPVCCETTDGGVTCTIADACEPGADHKRWECTRQTDCLLPKQDCYLDYISGATSQCMGVSDGIVIAVCETDDDCTRVGSDGAKCSHIAYSGSRSRSVESRAFKVCTFNW
jgi:hypothetical protein